MTKLVLCLFIKGDPDEPSLVATLCLIILSSISIIFPESCANSPPLGYCNINISLFINTSLLLKIVFSILKKLLILSVSNISMQV